jgi:hypothetical protein
MLERCPALPLSLLSAPAEEVHASLTGLLLPDSAGPVLTEWEVPARTDVLALRTLAAVLEQGA